MFTLIASRGYKDWQHVPVPRETKEGLKKWVWVDLVVSALISICALTVFMAYTHRYSLSLDVPMLGVATVGTANLIGTAFAFKRLFNPFPPRPVYILLINGGEQFK